MNPKAAGKSRATDRFLKMEGMDIKTIILFLTIMLVGLPANAADFRGVSWGATAAEIQKAEGRKADNASPQGLIYVTTLAGIKCLAMYGLKGGQLSSGVYSFVEHRKNNGLYILDFEKINDLLTKKYGSPQIADQWVNETYKNKPKLHGTALWLGHLSKISGFTNGETSIAHVLNHEDEKISHRIYYQNKAVIKKNSNKAENTALDAL